MRAASLKRTNSVTGRTFRLVMPIFLVSTVTMMQAMSESHTADHMTLCTVIASRCDLCHKDLSNVAIVTRKAITAPIPLGDGAVTVP